MKLDYGLFVEQQQKLVMTPELIQAIKILQLGNYELRDFVSEQVLSNPILEYEGGCDSDIIAKKQEQDKKEKIDEITQYLEVYGHKNSYEYSHYTKKARNDFEGYKNYEESSTSEVTLVEHLNFQLQFMDLTKEERKLGKFIIESLDENGYMTITSEDISNMYNISLILVEKIVKIIQGFEPIGICATSLEDCLNRQLYSKGVLSKEIETIIEEHIVDLSNNNIINIAKAMDRSNKDVQEMVDIIKTCRPFPGRIFYSGGNTQYIVPDIKVKNKEGSLIATMTRDSMPRLMISPYYEKLLKTSKDNDTIVEFLSGRMESALWLIKSIEQRKSTVESVVNAMLLFQKDFFFHGEKHLRSLTLKDVAGEVGIHESTVSRAIHGKYLECDYGVYELKYFFTAGVAGGEGEGNISSNSVKSHIKDLIEKEDDKKPLSDQKIVNMLGIKGINISRRTVAKYRDEMDILASSKRKRY